MMSVASSPTSDTGHMPDRRTKISRTRWIAGGTACVLVTVAITAGGVILGSHLSSRPMSSPQSTNPTTQAPASSSPPTITGTASSNLAADFATLQAQLHGPVGIAVTAVGAGQPPITLGDLQSGPAWSTIKVPLVIAALREEQQPTVTDAMRAAITESDNAAAESIWASLGDPATAARKVDAVLRETGDPTTVQSQRVRQEFSAFGQTEWPLADQVRFISVAVCDKTNAPVFALMGQVQTDQRWGLGALPGSRFKGGWGPSPTGSYLVRQMGVLVGPAGMIAVALAAQPASGKFDDGVAALTEMATWLTEHLSSLPAGHC